MVQTIMPSSSMIDRSIHHIQATPSSSKRRVIISDIHGNLPLLKRLLAKLSYHPQQDELFLLGDLIEKGAHSLDTLHFIMELSKASGVHPMMGNCDFVCKNILYSYRLDMLKQLLLQRKNSILHEMAALLHITVDERTDMEIFSSALRSAFFQELSFIASLPHVIETKEQILVHAGITNEKSFGEDMRDVMTMDMFYEKAKGFQKDVIVGHLPVSEYSLKCCSFSPLIDKKRHVIAIDGGNVVHPGGQLNALLFQDDRYRFESADLLLKGYILSDYHPLPHPSINITWHTRFVKILEEKETLCRCYHMASRQFLWIPRSFLYKEKGEWCANPYTNFRHHVCKAERVSYLSSWESYALIKKDGVLGWIPSSHLSFSKAV